MNMLDTSMTPGSQEDSFFSARDSQRPNIMDVSHEFWLANTELLGEDGMDPSMVLQYAYHDGEYIDLEQLGADDHGESSVHTLVFKAQSITSFIWQLTRTHPDGRRVQQLEVGGDGLRGLFANLDRQGRSTKTGEMTLSENGDLASEIFSVATSSTFRERTESVRRKRQKFLEEQLEFSLYGKKKFVGEALRRKEENYEELVAKIRFPMTALFQIAKT